MKDQMNNNSKLTDFTNDNPAYYSTKQEWKEYLCKTFEVANIFKNLPNITSTGIDNIPAIILKHLPRCLIEEYTIVFNNALNNRYFPIAWKKAKVIPIPKAGENTDAISSYRPISLNASISKIFEAVIIKSVNKHCNDQKIIPNNQFGFKHNHSTCHAISKLLTDTKMHLSNNKMVAAALIDLEKAISLAFSLVQKSPI